jgi:Heterokaryon incompatibility protein (HET)
MRLLNASSIELENFSADKHIPDYAILSHVWETEEVLFADMGKSTAVDMAGYKKLRFSCKQALTDSLKYVWIDTCCIDKSSSAELSEAINSMYSWYKGAKKCYAYMADFPAKVPVLTDSRWFTRGWTLQELIAPLDVIFYSGNWIESGTKLTRKDILAKRTGIDVDILTREKGLESASVARRMSWAWNRETTRTEDEAYCLMGLFNVNMSMLYGEGSNAFIRLQQKIMKHSDDQSLFAWIDSSADPASSANPDSYHGLLAKSPKNFETTGNIVPYRDWELSAPFSISNKGLRIDLCLSRYKEDLYVAALDCPAPPDYEGFVGIFLKRITTGDRQYARVNAQALCRVTERGNAETVYVRQSPSVPGPQDIYRLHAFQLRKGPTQENSYKLIKTIAPSGNDKALPIYAPFSFHRDWTSKMQSTFKITKGAGQLAGALLFERHDGERFVILLGSMANFTIGFDVASLSDIESIDLLHKNFKPQAPGTNMVLENHQIRIDAEPRIHEWAKYYMVDIVVEAIYHSLNPFDLIKDIIPTLQNEPDERPHSARVNLARGFGRIKSALKF